MTLHWNDEQAEIHKVVVGPYENNVFILRCTQTGDAVLLDTQEMMTSTYQLAGDELEDYRRFAGDGLFRLSVGLEAPDDLIDDLDQALSG